jgi:hypothetical protein
MNPGPHFLDVKAASATLRSFWSFFWGSGAGPAVLGIVLLLAVMIDVRWTTLPPASPTASPPRTPNFEIITKFFLVINATAYRGAEKL